MQAADIFFHAAKLYIMQLWLELFFSYLYKSFQKMPIVKNFLTKFVNINNYPKVVLQPEKRWVSTIQKSSSFNRSDECLDSGSSNADTLSKNQQLDAQ